MQFEGLSTVEQQALLNALIWFKFYHKNDSMDNFKFYMAAFDRACGLTGWTDVAVLEWLKVAADAKA